MERKEKLPNVFYAMMLVLALSLTALMGGAVCLLDYALKPADLSRNDQKAWEEVYENYPGVKRSLWLLPLPWFQTPGSSFSMSAILILMPAVCRQSTGFFASRAFLSSSAARRIWRTRQKAIMSSFWKTIRSDFTEPRKRSFPDFKKLRFTPCHGGAGHETGTGRCQDYPG